MNTNWTEIKKSIYTELNDSLRDKIQVAKITIQEIKESRNDDTKSSAGDKFETGREMMQEEMNKNELQLNNAIELQQKLAKIDLEYKHTQVGLGSLVITTQGSYFISIGVGKIEVNEKIYYAISLA